MLTSIKDDGTLNWSYSYNGIYAHNPNTANSMIVVGSYIYAVGWFDLDTISGALLKVPANTGILADCDTELEPSENSTDYEDDFTILDNDTEPGSDDYEVNRIAYGSNIIHPCDGTERFGNFEEEGLNNEFSIYYNPNGFITIDPNAIDVYTNSYSFNVYDIIGKRILYENILLKTNIPTSQLPRGVYIIEISSNTGYTQNKKIVIY